MSGEPGPREGSGARVAVAGPEEAWRRTVHVASGALGPLAAGLPPPVAALAFGGLVATAGAAEVARLASPRVHAWLDRFAGVLFRPAEARRISGATTLAVGYALAWWLFPVGAAERAILVEALADPMAATVGSRAGGSAGKTWAGTAACAVTAALVLLLTRVPPLVAGTAAVAAAVAERAPWRGVDNITVPVLVAAVLRLLA